MNRVRLPNRRPSELVTIDWAGSEYTLGFSRDSNGAVIEVFLTGAKSGGDLDALLNDASVLLSIGLQHGASIEELRKSLARDGATGGPASIIGAALAEIAAPQIGRICGTRLSDF